MQRMMTQVDKSLSARAFAVTLLVLGIAILVLLAEPLIQSVQKFSVSAGIPSFYVAFVLVPLATNARTAISAIRAVSQKKQMPFKKGHNKQATDSLIFSEVWLHPSFYYARIRYSKRFAMIADLPQGSCLTPRFACGMPWPYVRVLTRYLSFLTFFWCFSFLVFRVNYNFGPCSLHEYLEWSLNLKNYDYHSYCLYFAWKMVSDHLLR